MSELMWKTTEGGLREYLRHFDTEDLVTYHSFWDQCPRCDSLNTHPVDVRHPISGVEVDRKCDNCGKEWGTKVYNSEWLEETYSDDDFTPSPDGDLCPHCRSTNTERIDTISDDPVIWVCQCGRCAETFEVLIDPNT